MKTGLDIELELQSYFIFIQIILGGVEGFFLNHYIRISLLIFNFIILYFQLQQKFICK